jgi:hypothetical protein
VRLLDKRRHAATGVIGTKNAAHGMTFTRRERLHADLLQFLWECACDVLRRRDLYDERQAMPRHQGWPQRRALYLRTLTGWLLREASHGHLQSRTLAAFDQVAQDG